MSRQIRQPKKRPNVGSHKLSALDALKTTESRETLLLIIEDPDAKKMLVAWTLYQPEFCDRPLRKDETIDRAWVELWDSIGHINFGRLSRLAGVPYQTAIQTFNRLRDCHLIFPDGSISLNAKNIIATEVAGYLKSILPHHRPPPAESPQKPTPALGSGPPRKGIMPQ